MSWPVSRLACAIAIVNVHVAQHLQSSFQSCFMTALCHSHGYEESSCAMTLRTSRQLHRRESAAECASVPVSVRQAHNIMGYRRRMFTKALGRAPTFRQQQPWAESTAPRLCTEADAQGAPNASTAKRYRTMSAIRRHDVFVHGFHP